MYKNLFVFMVIALPLGGCGFKPQFLDDKQGNIINKLKYVKIDNIPDRHGQLLRNKLINLINPDASTKTSYGASVKLDVYNRDIGLDKNLTVNRAEVSIVATYKFYPIGQPGKIVTGRCYGANHYNVSTSHIYQTVVAQQNVPLRVLDVIADCIITRLSIYLSQPN